MNKIFSQYPALIKVFERILAIIVFLGVITLIINSIPVLLSLDWSRVESFYELIDRILLAVIGLELIRMLITHNMDAVLELLAFVIARKMLRPELSSMDIALSVLSFSALFVIYQLFNSRENLQKINSFLKNEKSK